MSGFVTFCKCLISASLVVLYVHIA